MNPNLQAELQRLRWRSRRGMRELDQLLERYLQHAWPQADARQRASYERLLECEDTQLWPWLLGHSRPDDPELDELVQLIRSLPLARS